MPHWTRVALAAVSATILLPVTVTLPAAAAPPVPGSGPAGTGQSREAQRPGQNGSLEMGFFEQWSIYGRGFGLAQSDREGQIRDLTDLEYAFGGVLPADGPASTPDPASNPVTCQSVDSWADYGTPYLSDVDGGNPVAASGLAGNFEQLRELKAKYPGLRVILSLGGYTGSTFFSDAASSPASRSAFVASCIDRFVEGNLPGLPAGAAAGIFDGFDLDWEYPGNDNGAPGNHFSPADIADYPLLAAEFRRQLDALSRTQRGHHRAAHYRITADLPAGLQNAKDLDIAALSRTLDAEVLMDYDFQGPWNPQGPTNFESNLFSSPLAPDTNAEPRISVDSSVRYFERHGAPAAKLVIGIPYYGHGWTGVPAGDDFGLYQSATGPALSPDVTWQGALLPGLDGADPAGTTDYYELAGQPGFSRHTDPITGASWLYNPDTKTFWSMQDSRQVAAKAHYIREHHLAGASVWDLAGDANNELTAALTAGLHR